MARITSAHITCLFHPKLTASVILLTLFSFGLHPKGALETNNVSWLSHGQGLHFQAPAMAYVDTFDLPSDTDNGSAFTIALGFEPASIETNGVQTLLMFHDGDDQTQLIVWQWGRSIIVMNGNDYDYSDKQPRIASPQLLSPRHIHTVVITSDHTGTTLLLDGNVVADKENLHLRLPLEASHRYLVFANSLNGTHGWDGTLYDFALFDSSMDREDVMRHFTQTAGFPRAADRFGANLLFHLDFQEVVGKSLPDQAEHKNHLVLPQHISSLDRSLLALPNPSNLLSYPMLVDMALNLAGFLILSVAIAKALKAGGYGFSFQGYAFIFLFCVAISLLIESSQVWIPGRDSSLLDLFLNGSGALLGIVFFARYIVNYPIHN